MFLRSRSFVLVPSFWFLRSGSFVQVPSFRFLRSGSFVPVPSFWLLRSGSFVSGARPLDGGDYHSGGRPPIRRAGARTLDGGDYHMGGCLAGDYNSGGRPRARLSDGRAPARPIFLYSLEIPVFPIFACKNSGKIVKIGFSDSRDQNKILKFS